MNKKRPTKEDKLAGRRESNLKWYYGITSEEYDALFAKQKGLCAICLTHHSKFSKRMCVDHDHKTKKIRGLLCLKCNTALGLLNEDDVTFQRAVIYLKRHKL